MTTLHIRVPGERFNINGLWELVRTDSRVNGLSWRVCGVHGDRRVEASFQASPERFIGVDQVAPDGKVIHVVTSAVADGAITISGKHGRGWTPIFSAVSKVQTLHSGTRPWAKLGTLAFRSMCVTSGNGHSKPLQLLYSRRLF